MNTYLLEIEITLPHQNWEFLPTRPIVSWESRLSEEWWGRLQWDLLCTRCEWSRRDWVPGRDNTTSCSNEKSNFCSETFVKKLQKYKYFQKKCFSKIFSRFPCDPRSCNNTELTKAAKTKQSFLVILLWHIESWSQTINSIVLMLLLTRVHYSIFMREGISNETL